MTIQVYDNCCACRYLLTGKNPLSSPHPYLSDSRWHRHLRIGPHNFSDSDTHYLHHKCYVKYAMNLNTALLRGLRT